MKVAVIGAGVIGLCTAYELAAQGHRVTVLDRLGSAAEGASFANGSLLSAAVGSALYRQSGLGDMFSAWSSRQPAIQWHGSARAMLRWLWRWRKAQTSARYADCQRQLHELARYSQQQLNHLSLSLGLEVDQSQGLLLLCRTAEDSHRLEPVRSVLQTLGIEHGTVTPEEARTLEPALRADTPLDHALHLPLDASANCRQFALLLKAKAEELGVQFDFNADVQALSKQQPEALRWNNGARSERFDAVVVCSGHDSQRLLSPLGIKLPTQQFQAYSISAAVREPLDAPRSAVFDEHHQVGIARLGNRVRVTGGVEFGHRAEHDKARLQMLYKVLDDWFPGAARTHEHTQIWKSSTICTADSLPLIGASGIPRVWLNLAHGFSGWTLACGSARALADALSGRSAGFSLQGFGLDRLRA